MSAQKTWRILRQVQSTRPTRGYAAERGEVGDYPISFIPVAETGGRASDALALAKRLCPVGAAIEPINPHPTQMGWTIGVGHA